MNLCTGGSGKLKLCDGATTLTCAARRWPYFHVKQLAVEHRWPQMGASGALLLHSAYACQWESLQRLPLLIRAMRLRKALRKVASTVESFGNHAVEEGDVVSGDHIYCYRKCGTYSHHGIAQRMDGGRLYVYHFRGDVDKCLREECPNRHDGRSCYSVDARRGQSAVVFSCVDCFAKGHCLHVHSYGVHPKEYNRERPGSCSTHQRYPAEFVLDRASQYYHNGFDTGVYSLTTLNCEHFALDCCTGQRLPSHQIFAVGSFGTSSS